MSFGYGIAAAITSPLVTTIGFYIWQHHWYGSSAFALNLYKCTLASMAFFVTVVCIWIFNQQQNQINNSNETTTTTTTTTTNLPPLFPSHIFTTTAVGYLFLSSIIGIVIGDVLWLQALSYLGAQRVIFVDSLKPFIAALFGYWVLNESIRIAALGGIGLTVIGILMVSLEKEQEQPQHDHVVGDDNEPVPTTAAAAAAAATTSPSSSQSQQPLGGDTTIATHSINDPQQDDMDNTDMMLQQQQQENSTAGTHRDGTTTAATTTTKTTLYMGYTMSLLNVILDTYGAVLTKQYGINMSSWEINLLRFGFASIVMMAISICMHLYHGIMLQYWYNYYHTTTATTEPHSQKRIVSLLPSSTGKQQQQQQVPCEESDIVDDVEEQDSEPVTTITTTTSMGNDLDPREGLLSEMIAVTGGASTQNGDKETTTKSRTVVVVSSSSSSCPWYALPISLRRRDDNNNNNNNCTTTTTMTRQDWMYVSMGVACVTFIAPTLSNYALFEIALALTLTLTSIGPLYALPMTWYYYYYWTTRHLTATTTTADQQQVQNPITIRATSGALLTVGGVVILAFWGTIPEE